MSYDGISAQPSEHQPLTPLNTLNGRGSQGLKSRKALKSSKENKPAVEICEVQLNEMMDLQLAGRLTSTAIDQFLFFMNQVPFPVSRLANVPAVNDKTHRLRSDFMTAHARLSRDMRAALAFSAQTYNGSSPPSVRVVVTLGSIMMPKAAMLFQASAVFKPVPIRLMASTGSTVSVRSQSSGSHELPPDSDSDHEELGDESTPYGKDKTSVVLRTPIKTAPSTPSSRSPFTPFSDEDGEEISPRVTQPLLGAPQKGLSPRPTVPSRSFASSLGTKPIALTRNHISDENQTSKDRLEMRFKGAERDLTVALSNLDMFTEETELSKIHVYVQAPRTFESDGWHPRPSAARILDSLTKYPYIDTAAKSKLAKMNVCAIKVTAKDGEEAASSDASRDLEEAEECVWMEWDGKLIGVE